MYFDCSRIRFRLRGEVLGLVHPHQIRPEMQHQRGLDLAAMDAVSRLMLADHALGIAEAAPLGGDDGHLVTHPEFARDNAHDIDIAAMRVDDHHLAQTGFRHLGADRGPHGNQQLGAERQRARTIDMLIGLADFLRRQNQNVEIVLSLPAQFRQHAVGNRDVGRHRQMRPVLLGGRDRQNGDGGVGAEPGKVVGVELVPVEWGCHRRDPLEAGHH
jgi:hypothetical protein